MLTDIVPRWSAIFVLHALLFGVFIPSVEADDFRDRYEIREFKNLPYRLLQPMNYDAEQSYPLVIFFHGAGECGTDNEKQLVHGMADFASDDVMQQHPCFVVAPQCPDGDQWVDTPWTADSHTMPEEPTDPMRLSLELIGVLQNEFSIDQVVSRLKGEPGDSVTLTVVHRGESKKEEITIVREIVQVETVLGDHRRADQAWDFFLDDEKNIGYIRITGFSRNTARDLRKRGVCVLGS